MKEPQTKPHSLNWSIAYLTSSFLFPPPFLLLFSSSLLLAMGLFSHLLAALKEGKCFFVFYFLQAVHLQRGKTGRHHGESDVNGSGRKRSLDVQRSKVFKCLCLTRQIKMWANRWLMSPCIPKTLNVTVSLLHVLDGSFEEFGGLKGERNVQCGRPLLTLRAQSSRCPTVGGPLGSVFWMTADVAVVQGHLVSVTLAGQQQHVAGATYARGGDDDDGWPESLLGRHTGTAPKVEMCVSGCLWAHWTHVIDEHLVERRQAWQSVTN